jgi:hypothetical protein
MSVSNGDLMLAQDYLERVAGSNAEDVAQAAELLKKVRLIIQETHDKGKGKMVDTGTEDAPVADVGEGMAMITDQ